jgi:hypothetical protein
MKNGGRIDEDWASKHIPSLLDTSSSHITVSSIRLYTRCSIGMYSTFDSDYLYFLLKIIHKLVFCFRNDSFRNAQRMHVYVVLDLNLPIK